MSGDFEYQWAQLVARAWADPAFKARLMDDPEAVLEENGLEPPGKRVRVMADTNEVVNLVIPTKPAPQELSEEELQTVGAGPGGERCYRCGDGCYRCGDESCYRCERC